MSSDPQVGQLRSSFIQSFLCRDRRSIVLFFSALYKKALPQWGTLLEPERLEVGTRIQTFSPETYLLILCIEGRKEGWNLFSRLCDVAALISSHPQMNWESLTEQARRLKIKRILDFGLVLANTLLKAPVPASVLSSVKQAPLIKWLTTELGKNLFSEPDSQPHPFYLWATFLYQGQLYRLLLFWVTPNEADQAFLPLPRPLHFLYYLIRPIRLVGKYGLAPFQPLFKRLYQEASQ